MTTIDATEDVAFIPSDVPASTTTVVERRHRLRTGLATVRTQARGVDGERVLFLLGNVAILLGGLIIGIAWYGASDSAQVYEQIPYVVSGAFGGLALVVVGSMLYGAWWITRAVRERREQHAQLVAQNEAILEALTELNSARPQRAARRS